MMSYEYADSMTSFSTQNTGYETDTELSDGMSCILNLRTDLMYYRTEVNERTKTAF